MSVKLLVISGSHPRHKFAVKPLTEIGIETLVIKIGRENMIPEPPVHLDKIDTDNFKKHFKERELAEEFYFGNTEFVKNKNLEYWEPDISDINSPEVTAKIIDFNPTIAVVFGSGLLNDRLLKILPEHTVNLHLGLSPHYKGSATLFWPFYMLEPQFAGFTIHKIVKRIDAGVIYSQGTPVLEFTDGIHDVGCKTVIEAQHELLRLVMHLIEGNRVNTAEQKGTGKLWLVSDFKAHHLRIIYSTFSNSIVAEHLNGKLSEKSPTLHVGF